jgi:hypothetical protein
MSYGEFRRAHVHPHQTVKLVPLLKIGPLVLVIAWRR